MGGLCKILGLTGITFELDELWVDFKERRGLFSKSDRPKGYGWISAVGSPSGGSDLLWTRSNRGHPKQIGRTRGKRVDGGGAGRRETFPAAAPRRRGSNPVFPGPNQPGFGCGLAYTTCVIYLWPKLGSGRPGAVGSTAAAGLCGGARQSASVPVPGWPTGFRV